MERLFRTHAIRSSQEVEGLWDFQALNQENNEVLQVVVPSCWESYPGYENYRGTAAYTKQIITEGNVRLLFKGVSHTADVYFDEELVAHHYNAYTPFQAIIKDVNPGEHTIKVIVDNSYNEESALHFINDYFTYGGINRPVVVEKIDDTFIEYVHVTPYLDRSVWNGRVEFGIYHLTEAPGKIKVMFELNDKVYELEEAAIQKGMNKISKTFSFEDVTSYELGAPKLYSLHAKLYKENQIIDDLIDRVGFREVKVEGNQIFFNNKAIKIKGFNRHEDHAIFGCAIPLEAMDYDLALMMDMGANAVRTCHYPNDERFLDLCDEKGILVWEEGHARGLNEEQMRHKNFRKQSLDCIEEMIINHYNHPSIFIWGILNECASYSEYGRECYIEQFDLIKEMDRSRPTTFASCHPNTDICMDLPDVVSMNVYPLWYHDSPAIEYVNKVYDWVQSTEGNGKPYIVSEIGAGAIYGYRANSNPKWSEDRQCDIIKQQLEAVDANENIVGVFIWQFCDGRVPDENFYGRPRCNNNKGVVDEYRRRKLAYNTVKECFNK